MKEAIALIQELAALTGADVALSPEGVAELVADGNALTLRWREEDQDWLCYGVALDGGCDPLAREVLARALEFNLFGADALGLHVGLFANAIVLSATCPAAGLTAEAFAERLLFLSAQIDALGKRLAVGTDGAAVPRRMPFRRTVSTPRRCAPDRAGCRRML